MEEQGQEQQMQGLLCFDYGHQKEKKQETTQANEPMSA